MKKVYIFDAVTDKDITSQVSLELNYNGYYKVIDAQGRDITIFCYFGVEDCEDE